MVDRIVETPTLQDAAQRNSGVNAAKVTKYLEVVKALRAQGAIEKPSYDIQHPLSSRGSIGQSTQASTQRNH